MEAYRDRKFRAPLILTSALVFNFALWPSYHRERTPLSDENWAGWTPEPVRTFFRGDTYLLHLQGFEPRIVQPASA
jgi:hypothetical protein